MKKIFFLTMAFIMSNVILPGQSKNIYPEPEFTNEVYYLKKTAPILLCDWKKVI